MNPKLMHLLEQRTEFYPHTLESDYPALLDRMQLLWGTPEFDTYTGELMLSNRSGRQGFPIQVAMELFHLTELHKSQMERRHPSRKDIWDELPDDAHRGTMDWGDI